MRGKTIKHPMQKNLITFFVFFVVVFSMTFIFGCDEKKESNGSPKTYSGVSVKADLGTINRATPLFGFNANGHLPPNIPTAGSLGAHWLQQAFIDSVAYLNPSILRYPGGIVGNHWDWQTGWYKPSYGPPGIPLQIRIEEFKAGLSAANADGLFLMNMETSDAHSELDGVKHALQIGIVPKYIELGNEHNLYNASFPLQFMTSANYAQLAKTYYDSIISAVSNAKFCVVGGNTNQRPDWHSQILSKIPTIDAFAWHLYIDADNSDLAFNVYRALAVPFGSQNVSGSIDSRYYLGGFDPASLPGKEVWVTEYNLWETQTSSAPIIAETWTHVLYLQAMHHTLLQKNNVTMLLNHGATSIDEWHTSISKSDHHITANGIAMKLIMDAAKGSNTCNDITFEGNPVIEYENVPIPKLIGWKFNFSGYENGLICNFSKDTFNVAFQNVFEENIKYSQFWADTAYVVNGFNGLNQKKGTTDDILTVYPFAVVTIRAN